MERPSGKNAVHKVSSVFVAVFASACALGAAPAKAQSDTPPSADEAVQASTDSISPDSLNFDALALDPATLTGAPKPLRLPGYADGKAFDISHAAKADGSSTFTVAHPLPSDFNAKLGADFAPAPTAAYLPAAPLPAGTTDTDPGVAWASVGLANVGSLDARVDPNNDQSKLGTTLQRAVPLGSKVSLTLQDRFSFADSSSPRTGVVSSGLPLMAALPAAPAQIWDNEKKLKFDIASTGTTLSAGVATSSVDPASHRTLSAEQTIYGPLRVTTAISDIGMSSVSKSITAGLKLQW